MSGAGIAGNEEQLAEETASSGSFRQVVARFVHH